MVQPHINGASRTVASPLARVTRGKQARPLKVLVYGQAGIGKSTFASQAPAPLFLPTEDGTDQLDVARAERPQSWADVLALVDALTTETHPYKTLAIDTLGGVERLCWAEVCSAGKKSDIEAFGYGKGYIAAVDTWRALLARLERLQRERGLHVVLVDHAVSRTHKLPDADPFQRWRPSLHDKAADLLEGWCDAVLFATEQVVAVERKGKVRGTSSGDRVLRTTWSATHDAKNRFGLADPLPLSWADFLEGALNTAAIRARCLELIAQLPDDKRGKATAALEQAGDDPGALAGVLNRLTLTVAPTDTNKETDK
jgi:hypothetical protein